MRLDFVGILLRSCSYKNQLCRGGGEPDCLICRFFLLYFCFLSYGVFLSFVVVSCTACRTTPRGGYTTATRWGRQDVDSTLGPGYFHSTRRWLCCCCLLYTAAAAVAAAAAAAAAACMCSVLYGSHAKAVNRRLRGSLCSACVGRSVRCACVDPEPRALRFSLTARLCSKKNSTQSTRASMLM